MQDQTASALQQECRPAQKVAWYHGTSSSPDVRHNRRVCNGLLHCKQALSETPDHEQPLQGRIHVAGIAQIVEPRRYAGALHAQGADQASRVAQLWQKDDSREYITSIACAACAHTSESQQWKQTTGRGLHCAAIHQPTLCQGTIPKRDNHHEASVLMMRLVSQDILQAVNTSLLYSAGSMPRLAMASGSFCHKPLRLKPPELGISPHKQFGLSFRPLHDLL